jgi:hypothetical protein
VGTGQRWGEQIIDCALPIAGKVPQAVKLGWPTCTDNGPQRPFGIAARFSAIKLDYWWGIAFPS